MPLQSKKGFSFIHNTVLYVPCSCASLTTETMHRRGPTDFRAMLGELETFWENRFMASQKALRKMRSRNGSGQAVAASTNGNGEMSAAARKLLENAALRGATGSNNVTRERQLVAARAKRA